MGNGASVPGIEGDEIQAAIADLENVQKFVSDAEAKKICEFCCGLFPIAVHYFVCVCKLVGFDTYSFLIPPSHHHGIHSSSQTQVVLKS